MGIQNTTAQIPYLHPTRARSLILQKMRAAVRLIYWRALQPTVTLSSGIAVALKSESDWEIANEIFVQGDYDEAIAQALRCRDSVHPVRILDLGANAGLFSLRCVDRYLIDRASSGLELIAIEGSPSVFAGLQQRLAGASGHQNMSLTARQGLVGRRSGKGMIYSSVFHSCTNTVVREGAKTSRNIFLNRRAEDSKYLDLDELIPPAAAVDLIKCDIEGSELAFVQNYESLLRRTRLLVIELHPGHCDVETCRELLDAYGLRKVRTVKSRPTHSLEMYAINSLGQ